MLMPSTMDWFKVFRNEGLPASEALTRANIVKNWELNEQSDTEHGPAWYWTHKRVDGTCIKWILDGDESKYGIVSYTPNAEGVSMKICETWNHETCQLCNAKLCAVHTEMVRKVMETTDAEATRYQLEREGFIELPYKLFKDIQDVLNTLPSTSVEGCKYESTYDLASALDSYAKSIENT